MSSISFIGLGAWPTPSPHARSRAATPSSSSAATRPRPRTWPPSSAAGPRRGHSAPSPLGDIVVLAVPYASAVPVVAQYGDALAGKVIIDITNTFNADATGLVTP